MKRIFAQNGAVVIRDVLEPVIGPAEVLVQTAFSVVSTGTETHIINATAETGETDDDQYPAERPWGPQLRTHGIRWDGPAPLRRPPGLSSLGYSLSGTVLAVGSRVADLKPGDAVACSGSQCAVHAERVSVPRNLVVRVPQGVRLDEAAFVTVGSVSLHSLRRAGCELGETVVVMGLGLIGLLVVQMARVAGMYTLGLDPEPSRLVLARELGCDRVLDPRTGDPLTVIREMTDGFGADAVLLTAKTDSSEPLNLAFEMCRQRATVVGVGLFGMNINRRSMFERDVKLVASVAYGPGRYDPVYEEGGVDYPIGHARWTENRNMSAFLRLLSRKTVAVSNLVPERFAFSEASAAYERLLRSEPRPATVLFAYGSAEV